MSRFNSSLFFRRLKLYGVGVGLGLMLSYAFFGDRYPTWLPGSRVKEELLRWEITYSEKANCQMKCSDISQDAITELITSGDVNFGESDVHGEPCPSYVIEGETPTGRSLRLVLAKCDSISDLTSITDISKKHDCPCN